MKAVIGIKLRLIQPILIIIKSFSFKLQPDQYVKGIVFKEERIVCCVQYV